MSASAGLRRYTTEKGRVYADDDGTVLPSVTTVLSHGGEPEAIKAWKRRHNGKNGKRDWRDILAYKSARGTLIHHGALNRYAESDLWGPEEERAEEAIREAGKTERYADDAAYAERAWAEVAEDRGIDPSSVMRVEEFVTNTEVGYAGQFDLMYVDEDMNVVLADIKTGKGVYDKYKVQLAAYDNAVEHAADRLEVIRVNPDRQEWEVSTSDEWPEDRSLLWGKFLEARVALGDITELAAEAMSGSEAEYR